MKYQLTIFFDGRCPLCCMEMDKLKRRDTDNNILLVDIHSDAFVDYPYIEYDSAMGVLHGIYQGKLLLGLDVTHRAWSIVGLGFLVAPLQWPLVKPMSHQIYLIVARYRNPISQFLYRRFGLGKAQCEDKVCFKKRQMK